MATGQDVQWPKIIGGQAPDRLTRMVQGYLDLVLATMQHSGTVTESFFYVQNMLKPPITLFHPKIMWEVLKPRSWHKDGAVRSPSSPIMQPAAVSGD